MLSREQARKIAQRASTASGYISSFVKNRTDQRLGNRIGEIGDGTQQASL